MNKLGPGFGQWTAVSGCWVIPKKFGDPTFFWVSCAHEALVKPLWVFLGPLFFFPEIIDHGSRSWGTSQRRQKLESKAADSAGGQPAWNVTDSRPRKMVLYLALGTWWLGWAASTGCKGSSLMMVVWTGQDVDLRVGGRGSRQMRMEAFSKRSEPSFVGWELIFETRVPGANIFILQNSSVYEVILPFIKKLNKYILNKYILFSL